MMTKANLPPGLEVNVWFVGFWMLRKAKVCSSFLEFCKRSSRARARRPLPNLPSFPRPDPAGLPIDDIPCKGRPNMSRRLSVCLFVRFVRLCYSVLCQSSNES